MLTILINDVFCGWVSLVEDSSFLPRFLLHKLQSLWSSDHKNQSYGLCNICVDLSDPYGMTVYFHSYQKYQWRPPFKTFGYH